MFVFFLQNLGMGAGGASVSYVMSDPFAAYVTTCTASAGGCTCI